jgi:hypothetical protein
MSSSLTYRWTYTTTATNPVNALTWTGGQVSKDTTVATSREGTYQVLLRAQSLRVTSHRRTRER